MKRLHSIISAVIDKMIEYFDILEKQRERALNNTNQDAVSNEDRDLSEYIINNLKMKASIAPTTSGDFRLIQRVLIEADVYEPLELNSLFDIGTSHRLRTKQYRFMTEMLQNGLPFVIPEVFVFHFKLPSQGLTKLFILYGSNHLPMNRGVASFVTWHRGERMFADS